MFWKCDKSQEVFHPSCRDPGKTQWRWLQGALHGALSSTPLPLQHGFLSRDTGVRLKSRPHTRWGLGRHTHAGLRRQRQHRGARRHASAPSAFPPADSAKAAFGFSGSYHWNPSSPSRASEYWEISRGLVGPCVTREVQDPGALRTSCFHFPGQAGRFWADILGGAGRPPASPKILEAIQ